MKKAIVTGANGFIGRYIIRELAANGVEIYGVGKCNADWSALKGIEIQKIECDLREIARLAQQLAVRDIDCIFHTAWQGVAGTNRQLASDWKVQLGNVEAVLNLIDVSFKMGIKTFVNIGSIHEFEVMKDVLRGQRITDSVNMYKSSKLAAHWMGKTRAGERGMRFFSPYIIGAYGEEDKPASLINYIVKKIWDNEIPALSEGSHLYDFVHVSDIAHALYLIAEKGVDGTEYIVGSGAARPLREFLIETGKIVNEIKGGKSVALGFGRHAGKAVCLPKEAFNISKLVQDTGFKPQISFREGIERTVRYLEGL